MVSPAESSALIDAEYVRVRTALAKGSHHGSIPTEREQFDDRRTARAVLGVSNDTQAKSAGRKKHLVARRACNDGWTDLNFSVPTEFMARQLCMSYSRAIAVCDRDLGGMMNGGAFLFSASCARRVKAWAQGLRTSLESLGRLDEMQKRRLERYAFFVRFGRDRGSSATSAGRAGVAQRSDGAQSADGARRREDARSTADDARSTADGARRSGGAQSSEDGARRSESAQRAEEDAQWRESADGSEDPRARAAEAQRRRARNPNISPEGQRRQKERDSAARDDAASQEARHVADAPRRAAANEAAEADIAAAEAETARVSRARQESTARARAALNARNAAAAHAQAVADAAAAAAAAEAQAAADDVRAAQDAVRAAQDADAARAAAQEAARAARARDAEDAARAAAAVRAAQAADRAAAEAAAAAALDALREAAARRERSRARASPALPPTRPAAAFDVDRDTWKAIDQVDVMASVLATCGYGEGIPKGLHAEWAEAFMDVLVKLEEARDDDERDRALRWQLLLHQILLRKPFGPSGRGGSRAHDVYRQRFAAWRNGVCELAEFAPDAV
ncbi:hypothetical protein M885DRAFT_580585 [Pelagophyceae sp. CCMP2097]|nr:hypothetical protein M885DRAFT_580585 [Pelagophyceae sp. CCMP2097]